jgi:hypothetical protein
MINLTTYSFYNHKGLNMKGMETKFCGDSIVSTMGVWYEALEGTILEEVDFPKRSHYVLKT